MKTPVLIELAIQSAMVAFAGKTRVGKIPIPTSTHSIRVGTLLLAFGYPVEVGIAGFCHDFEEDTSFNLEMIRQLFGERVAFLVKACTLDPSLEESGPGEDELFARNVGYAEGGDSDSLRIKCTDSLDNMRTCFHQRPELQAHVIEKGARWHGAAQRFFPDELLTYEIGNMVAFQRMRIRAL